MDVEFTGYADLPDALVILPGRDDAAEYDDNSENQNFNDDPKFVLFIPRPKISPNASLTYDLSFQNRGVAQRQQGCYPVSSTTKRRLGSWNGRDYRFLNASYLH